MLIATTDTQLGSARLHMTLAFDRELRCAIVRRDRLAYDTRFAAAAAGRSEPVGHVFLIVTGQYRADDGTASAAPIALVLADDEIERVGPTSRTFRTDGERVEIVHLRFAAAELQVPIGLVHAPRELPAAVWVAARGVVAEPSTLPALIDALATAHITRGTVTFQTVESERYNRLWSAFEPLVRTDAGSVSLKQVANTLGMSMRQVGRNAKDLATTFGFGGGYRDALLVMRLRTAAMLLSAPDVTLTDVAKAAGYGSVKAMARAFRDARLPAPIEIRDQLCPP